MDKNKIEDKIEYHKEKLSYYERKLEKIKERPILIKGFRRV